MRRRTSLVPAAGAFALVALAAALPARALPDPARCTHRIVGTQRADRIAGTPAADRVLGLGGDDRIAGEAGGDCLEGGRGADVLQGLEGGDLLLGFPGADLLEGGEGGDALSGGSGADVLRGGTGADRLDGGGGADRLEGGPGHDVLRAGAGRDRVYEVARSYLPPGPIDAGSNRVEGGPGADAINVANGHRDKVSCGGGRDTVLADRGDKLRGCERRRFLVSPIPQVSPRAGDRRERFMIAFRTLATVAPPRQFFSIAVAGPHGSSCRESVANSLGVVYHRGKVVRYRLGPFTGNGRQARRWCRGVYRGNASFVHTTRPHCDVRPAAAPSAACSERRLVGRFAFRVR
jgi:Ca2+-binding RTX toxin-like protein